MKKLYLVVAVVLGLSLILTTILTTACGKATPAPTATVTVTKTASAAPAATVTVTAAAATVTQTATPVTVTVTPTPAPTKLAKVSYSEVLGGSPEIFSLVAKEIGIFEKYGIDFEFKGNVSTSAARMAFFTGLADMTAADPTEFYKERKDLRIFSSHIGFHFNTIVRKDSPYQSYQDLKGKKIASLSPASASWFQAFKAILKLEGLDLGKDFEVLYGEYAVQIGWLLKGDVEAIHLAEPRGTVLLTGPDGGKVRELYWLNDLYKKHTGTDWLYGGLYTSEDWINKNTEVAKRVGLAWDELLSYVYAHDDVWRSDKTKKVLKIDDPVVLERVAQRMPAVLAHPRYGPAYKSAWLKRQQIIADVGLIPQEVVDWSKGIFRFADW